MEYLCSYCNKPFLPKRTDSMYCSHSCRQFAYVLRKSKGSIKELHLEKPIQVGEETSDVPIKKEIGNIDAQSKLENTIEPTIVLEKLPVMTDKEISVSTYKQSSALPVMTEKNSIVGESDYASYQSRYMVQLDRLYGERDVWYSLSKFFDANDEAGLWVSERYRCLTEVLLAFSEMKRIDLDDLKEVCNAFTDIINSKYYKCLHPSYPYIDQIKCLRDKIRNTCVEILGEYFKYRISREQKQNLIVTRFELSQFVPKRKFSELKFKEK